MSDLDPRTGRPSALSTEFETIPATLKAIPRWVLWRYVQRTKPDNTRVWAKLPMTTEGRAASSTDPATWASYDDAADALMFGDFDGLGLVITGQDFHGIDLDDCRDPATGELTDLAQEVLERVDGYAEVSPSETGIKLFAMTNLDASRTKKEAGVELYTNGRYFTVTGHRLNGHAELAPLAQDVGWFVERVWGEALEQRAGGAGGVDVLANLKMPLDGWDLERVITQVLAHLDPDCGYDEWNQVGMVLHHQGEGNEEWLAAWDAWSATSGKYAEGYCAEKWGSYSQQRLTGKGALTLATLLKKTKAQREQTTANAERAQIDAARALIDSSTDEVDLRGRVAGLIKANKSLDHTTREALVAAWNVRHKDLAGAKLPVADVRELLGVARVAQVMQVNTESPDWVQPWVVVTDVDKFFNLETKQEVTAQGFRAMHNRLMPFDAKGNRESADKWATDMWKVPVVAHKSYLPSAGPVFEMFGLQWANLYRPESVPRVPEGDFDDAQADAVETVLTHVRTYLADEREQQLLLSWCAHQVQRPGVKVRWSPYIHGVPGDGKSFFAELIAAAMGGQNVRSLNGSTLESNFTDWAVGFAVVAIEEMKQHGHNRYDIMNRVKPFITNSSVEIHPKGRPSYTAPNVSNYLIFSNYLDGAPVDDGDRRYMFVSSQVTTRAAKEMTESGYFGALFQALHSHPGALRKWLLEYQMHPEFDPNGRAPDTEIKATVVEMSKSDLELAAEELLERGAPGVARNIVSSAHFVSALTDLQGGVPLATVRVNTLLTVLGFRFFKRQLWKGKTCRLWARDLEVTPSDKLTANSDKLMAELYASSKDDFGFLD